MMMHPPHIDPALRAAVQRRGLLRGGFSLGALTMLTGCDLSDADACPETSTVRSKARKPRAAGVFQGIVTANPDFVWNPKIHNSPHFIEDLG